MAQAIDANADSSYDKSPAKVKAINSTRTWIHGRILHLLNIISALFANYRQYGCGGIKIVKLVVVTLKDRRRMWAPFRKTFHNP